MPVDLHPGLIQTTIQLTEEETVYLSFWQDFGTLEDYHCFVPFSSFILV